MKILLWIGPRTALIVIMTANMLVFPTRARCAQDEIEQQREISTIHQNVLNSLTDKGLEHEAAVEKVSLLMNHDLFAFDRQCQNFCSHPELEIDHEYFVNVLTMRLLNGRGIDMSEYGSLTGLVHEIKGYQLSQSQREAIYEIAKMNQKLT